MRHKLLAALALSIGLLTALLCQADARGDLFSAAKLDNKSQVQSLLRRGINPNLAEPERGETALMLAVRENSTEVLTLLLNARGINLDLRAKNGDTALMIAAYRKNRAAVEALLARGARVNQDGWTALHYAAAVGETGIVELLIRKSAEIDATSPNLTTPLMMAAGGGFIYTVKALLDAGADPNLINEAGLTAADFAKRNGHQDIVDGLEQRRKRTAQRVIEAEKRAVAEREEQARRSRLPDIDGRLPPME